MAKIKKNKFTDDMLKKQLSANEMQQTQANYELVLHTDPKYSTLADPTGELKLSLPEKSFIQHYVNFKSIATAAELAGIDLDVAKQYFVSYTVQSEIRRINRALYHLQFSHKLLSLDDLGGYLSSLLTDEHVPLADRLATNDKLRVVDMIIKVNQLKSEAIQDPSIILHKDIETNLRELSVETIQQMLASNTSLQEKKEAINLLDDGTLTVEERDYLSTLPIQDLLKMVEDIKKGG